MVGMFTLSPGVIAGGMMEFNFTMVNIVDDDIVESDEDFMLSLPNALTVEYTVGSPSSATVVIVNDDGTFLIQLSFYVISN